MIAQPLTQLIRVHAANRIAAAEVAASRDDLRKAETQVALDLHTLYFGILIATFRSWQPSNRAPTRQCI
jgi:hypothetical protein